MSDTHFELHFSLPGESLKEILIAELSDLGYESFWEKDEDLYAYISAELFSKEALEVLQRQYPDAFKEGVSIVQTDSDAWAARHEEDFGSILIAEQCLIYSPTFVKTTPYPFEIQLNSKLAFGSGQHISTALSIELLLKLGIKQKKVLDLGCGSGILAILAANMGAVSVLAVDNNPWAVRICLENVERNACTQIKVLEGDINTLSADTLYDVFLANIHAEVLQSEIPLYPQLLNPGGYLLLAGFLQKDEAKIRRLAQQQALQLASRIEKEDWIALLYQSDKNFTSRILF